jgi:hypothetical protein
MDFHYIKNAYNQRCLDRLVRAVAWYAAGHGSNPFGGEFVVAGCAYLVRVVKKNLLVCPTPKHRSKASLISRVLRCSCVWVG